MVIDIEYALSLLSALVLCPYLGFATFVVFPTHPLLGARDGKYKLASYEGSVTTAEADPWLGVHAVVSCT